MENSTKWNYPVTRRDEEATNKLAIKDPYHWLEDPDSPETVKWVEEQDKVTFEFINSWPHKAKLRERLTQIYDYPKYSSPFKKEPYYYFFKNNGLQNQSVLYQQKTLDGEAEVFFDANKLSEDGTVSIGSYTFSESGKLFAYSLSRSGSDWRTVHVMNTETKENLKDQLEWVKFSNFSWTHDDLGFFYSRYTKPHKVESTESSKAGAETDKSSHMMIYYHKLGTHQDEDILIYEVPSEIEYFFSNEVTDDGKYLLMYTYKGTNHDVLMDFAELANFQQEKKLHFTRIIDKFESQYHYITNEGMLFYFVTTENAPKKKIITIDFTNHAKENRKEIIPEKESTLESAICVNHDNAILIYSHDVHHSMFLYSLYDGKLIKELTLPSFGTVAVSGEKKHHEFFYYFTSFMYPGSIYRYDFETNEATLFRASEIKNFDPEKFETKQIFYKSKDGTSVPMYIITNKGTVQDGRHPTVLYGYGGFNISIMPSFNPFNIVLLENLGFNFAIANIRGGAEYGEEWHKAALKEKKQNVFDDFIAAAEYLIENKYTCPENLAIRGGSNGGLLVAACMNQRPDLFGCVISQVGVLDMLKFHLFTIGHYWKAEYGDPENPEDFKYIIKYSPLHNITKGKPYPAVLLTTADHDDRVVPLHSHKFIATLQHELGNEPYQQRPLMIRVEVKAGHGQGKPTTKVIEEFADMYAFMAKIANAQWRD